MADRDTLKLIANLEDGGFRRLIARLAILRAYARHREANHLSNARAQEEVAEAFSEKQLDVDDWVYAVYDSVTGRTLRRWEQQLRDGGLETLVDRHGRRSQRSYDSYFGPDSELRKIALHYVADHPDCTGPELRDELAEHVSGDNLPDVRTVQRFLGKMRS